MKIYLFSLLFLLASCNPSVIGKLQGDNIFGKTPDLLPQFTSLIILPGVVGNDSTPTVAGMTDPNATVTLHENSSDCSTAALSSISTDGSGNFSLTPSALAIDGSYSYRIKVVTSFGKIKCSDPLLYFFDTVAPLVSLSNLTGGEIIIGGVNTNLMWSASDVVGLGTTPIKLEYSLNSGSSWADVVSSAANSGSYIWSMPGFNTSSARIRVTVTDAAGNTASAASSSNFTIDSTSPALSLTSLTGGQFLKGSSSAAITWTASDTNTSGNWISISVSGNGGSTWTPILNTTNSGSYTWTVPTVDSSSYRIRITATDVVGHTTTVTSPSNFTIDSTAPVINLTSLTGGQVILNGSIQNINWTATDTNLTTTPITVELSSNNGTSWSTLVGNRINSGTYAWTASVVDANTYRVRVTAIDRAGNSATSSSASNFEVSSSAPNLTQTLIASPYYSNIDNSVTFGGACETGYNVVITGDQSASVMCTGSAWSWTTSTVSTDGTRNYTFTQTNAILTSSTSAQWIRDTAAPSLTAVEINNGDAKVLSNFLCKFVLREPRKGPLQSYWIAFPV